MRNTPGEYYIEVALEEARFDEKTLKIYPVRISCLSREKGEILQELKKGKRRANHFSDWLTAFFILRPYRLRNAVWKITKVSGSDQASKMLTRVPRFKFFE